MKLESVGILIAMRPLNNHDCLGRIFTRDFGMMAGVLRGAAIAKKNRPLVGQHGAVAWNARLDSQLGTFHWDADHNMSVPLMMSPETLAYMNSAFALIATMLAEREPCPAFYEQTIDMLNQMGTSHDLAQQIYLNWEIDLLRELGYALSLDKCAGCGGHTDLHFMSPRTCRAVCDECAAPYIDRLYRLPVDLTLTRNLLSHICDQMGIHMPQMRQILGAKIPQTNE